MTDVWMLYSTFGTREEALSVAEALLEKRLIACANVMDGALSVYRWEGRVQREPEAILFAKTRQEVLQDAIAEIKSRHSYQLPCIVAYAAGTGFEPFLRWVGEQTGG